MILTDPEFDSKRLCYFAAGSFVLSWDSSAYYGHGDVGDDLLHAAGVVDDGVKGVYAEPGMAEGEVFLRALCIQAYGNCVYDTAEIFCGISFIYEVRKAVGVDADSEGRGK